MVKVSIEVHYGTTQVLVAVKAQSIRQALRVVQARYPGNASRVKFPIEPESFFVENSAA